MELTFYTQENPIGQEIAGVLKSGKYSDFKATVAYSRNSGISRIYNELSEFSDKGGKTSIVMGIDQVNTSYQALVNLKTFAKDNLFIHHDKNFDITFHPKVYLFGNEEIEKIIVGSSNFTAGGLFLNYEANIGVTLDTSEKAKFFQKQVTDYWDNLLKDENTKICELSLLEKLLERGSVIDERKQRPFREIIEKISDDLPFKTRKKVKAMPPISVASTVNVPLIKEKFAMTLSGFDVSPKSLDPVILIPIAALKTIPLFWNWPTLYTDSGNGSPELYATANIKIDNKTIKEQIIRLYFWKNKDEFRLRCEAVKRNGKPGDMIVISKNYKRPLEFNIELIRSRSKPYNIIQPFLKNKVSNQKFFAYLN